MQAPLSHAAAGSRNTCTTARINAMLALAIMEERLDHSHLQYMSQQFVDQVCSADGPNDELVEEIERVILNAHLDPDALQAVQDSMAASKMQLTLAEPERSTTFQVVNSIITARSAVNN